MRPARRAKAGSDREADKALVAVLAALIVLLLFATNVQLWRLAPEDGGEGRTAATVGSALPPPVTGTSNDVLSRQMRRLSTPLNRLRSQLAGLQGLGAAQLTVARQIEAMNASIRRFDGVRREIGEMTKGLGKMVANTGDMSSGLASMGRDMSATRTSMSGMVKVMKQVQGGIAASNESSRDASSGIAAMSASMAAMSESFTATAAGSREMTASLATLNQQMGNLVEIFCVAFGSGLPACATSEALGSASLTPDASEESLGGDAFRQGLAPALPVGAGAEGDG